MITYARFDEEAIAAAAARIAQGGVVVLPTDTVIGLAASPEFSASIDRLYAMKDRPREKNLAVVVETKEQILDLGAQLPQTARKLLDSPLMPGALTLVLPLDAAKAPDWLKGRSEVAVRIPDHAGLLAVLKHTGAILATSANLSGKDTPEDALDAANSLTQQPDICIEGRGHAALPSTIVLCREDGVDILRQGAVPAADIYDLVRSA